MAKYPDLVTTKKGLDLNSAANAAQKAVIFTKVIVGDGDVPSDTSIGDLTAVVSPKMTLEITNKENLRNGHFTIRATLGNEELESGFYAKEIGVYAKLDGDVEVLYAYTNGGNYVDYIPDKSSPIDAQIFNIDVIISNLKQATIVISDEAHVTVKELKAHNDNDDAHKDFIGATTSKNGVRGMVPEPTAGDKDRFLCVDGTFKKAKMTTLELVDLLYPVGIIAEFTNDTDPNEIWPGTTWSKMDAGRVLVSAGDYSESGFSHTYTLGEKGGEAKHQLTTDELPQHSHSVAISSTNISGKITLNEDLGFTSSSGCFSLDNYSRCDLANNRQTNSNHTAYLNDTHSHNATISNTGGDVKHENRMPFTVVSCWYRTA